MACAKTQSPLLVLNGISTLLGKRKIRFFLEQI
jgi:hypothetical protein